MWFDKNGFVQSRVFCSSKFAFVNGTCEQCPAGSGSVWFQQDKCMPVALMRTQGLLQSQNYQNYLAGSAGTAASSLLANATNSTTPNATKPGALIQAWSGLSAWMLLDGALTYNAYNSHVTSLNTNNVGTITTWTTSWLQASTPLNTWFYLAYGLMVMNGISLLGVMVNAAGKEVLFYRFTQFGLMWPIIEIPLVGLTYT